MRSEMKNIGLFISVNVGLTPVLLGKGAGVYLLRQTVASMTKWMKKVIGFWAISTWLVVTSHLW